MNKIDKIIEDIQEAQVDVGGRFLRQNEIKNMTVEELLELLVPNGVEIKFGYNLKKEASQYLSDIIRQNSHLIPSKAEKYADDTNEHVVSCRIEKTSIAQLGLYSGFIEGYTSLLKILNEYEDINF